MFNRPCVRACRTGMYKPVLHMSICNLHTFLREQVQMKRFIFVDLSQKLRRQELERW